MARHCDFLGILIFVIDVNALESIGLLSNCLFFALVAIFFRKSKLQYRVYITRFSSYPILINYVM